MGNYFLDALYKVKVSYTKRCMYKIFTYGIHYITLIFIVWCIVVGRVEDPDPKNTAPNTHKRVGTFCWKNLSKKSAFSQKLDSYPNYLRIGSESTSHHTGWMWWSGSAVSKKLDPDPHFV